MGNLPVPQTGAHRSACTSLYYFYDGWTLVLQYRHHRHLLNLQSGTTCSWEWCHWLSHLCLGLLGGLLCWANQCPPLRLCPLLALHPLLVLWPWLVWCTAAFSVLSGGLAEDLIDRLALADLHTWMHALYFSFIFWTGSSICQPWASTAWSLDDPGRLPLPDSWWAGDHCHCQSAWRQWHDWWLERKGVNDLSSPGTYAGDLSLSYAQMLGLPEHFFKDTLHVGSQVIPLILLPQEEFCSDHIFGLPNQSLLVSFAWHLAADVKAWNLP